MKTIKGLLGYVGFGVSAIISQGRPAFGPGSPETGEGRKEGHRKPGLRKLLKGGCSSPGSACQRRPELEGGF